MPISTPFKKPIVVNPPNPWEGNFTAPTDRVEGDRGLVAPLNQLPTGRNANEFAVSANPGDLYEAPLTTVETWREVGGNVYRAENSHLLDFTGLDLATEQVLPTGERAIAALGSAKLENLGEGTLTYPFGEAVDENLNLTITLAVPSFVFVEFDHISEFNLYFGGGQKRVGVDKGAAVQVLQQPGVVLLTLNQFNPDFDYYGLPVGEFGRYILETTTVINRIIFRSPSLYGLTIHRIWAAPTQATNEGETYWLFRKASDGSILRIHNRRDPYEIKADTTDLERIVEAGGPGGATQLAAQDLRLAFVVAAANPSLQDIIWIDSAAPAFPLDAARNDLLRNDTGGEVTLDGVMMLAGEIRRATVDNAIPTQWEVWRSYDRLQEHISDTPAHDSLFTTELWQGEAPTTYSPPDGAHVPTFTGLDLLTGGTTPEGDVVDVTIVAADSFGDGTFTTTGGITAARVKITPPVAAYVFIEIEHGNPGDNAATGSGFFAGFPTGERANILSKPDGVPDPRISNGPSYDYYTPDPVSALGRYIFESRDPVTSVFILTQNFDVTVHRIWFSPTSVADALPPIYRAWRNRRDDALVALINEADRADTRDNTTGLTPYVPPAPTPVQVVVNATHANVDTPAEGAWETWPQPWDAGGNVKGSAFNRINGIFTAPIDGLYALSASFQHSVNLNGTAAVAAVYGGLFKGNQVIARNSENQIDSGSTQIFSVNPNTVYWLTKGETIQPKYYWKGEFLGTNVASSITFNAALIREA